MIRHGVCRHSRTLAGARAARWDGVQNGRASPPAPPDRGPGPRMVYAWAGYLLAACSRATTSPIAHIWRTSSLATAVLATLAFLPAPTRSW